MDAAEQTGQDDDWLYWAIEAAEATDAGVLEVSRNLREQPRGETPPFVRIMGEIAEMMTEAAANSAK